jgi:hypothetical protein
MLQKHCIKVNPDASGLARRGEAIVAKMKQVGTRDHFVPGRGGNRLLRCSRLSAEAMLVGILARKPRPWSSRLMHEA